MTVLKQLLVLAMIVQLSGCMTDDQFKERLTKTLLENPDILTKVIEEKPVEIIEAFQKAVKSAQSELAKRRKMEEDKKLEALYDKPLEPKIRKDEAIRGTKDAPLTLVDRT